MKPHKLKARLSRFFSGFKLPQEKGGEGREVGDQEEVDVQQESEEDDEDDVPDNGASNLVSFNQPFNHFLYSSDQSIVFKWT